MCSSDLFHLGDAYSAGNDKKRAVSSWFEGMAMADQLTGTRSVTLVDAYTSACRRLGQDAGERGDRKVAEGYAKKVQDFGGLKGQNPKANVPRVLAAQGSIYYALARSSAATGDDSKRATELLHQSAERWTALSREARLSVSAKRWQTEVQAEIERLDASANRTH